MTVETERITHPARALEARWLAEGPGLTQSQLSQTRVPLRALKVAPGVFQPRDMEEDRWLKRRHIDDMADAVRRGEKLDHIVVLPVGGKRYVVDGHCRLEAYHRAKLKDNAPVPVRHFTPRRFSEALELAARENLKGKLPLTLAERLEAAWKLVKLDHGRGAMTLDDISDPTGVGRSTVANMVKKAKALAKDGDADALSMTWAEAKRGSRKPTDDHDDAWQTREVGKMAELVRNALGPRPDRNPHMFRQVLEEAYPNALARAFPEVAFVEERGWDDGDEDNISDF